MNARRRPYWAPWLVLLLAMPAASITRPSSPVAQTPGFASGAGSGVAEADAPSSAPVRASSSHELHFFSDNLENALNKLGSSPSFSLENPADLNDFGYVYLYFARYMEAEEKFRRALRIRPGFAPAQLNMGVSSYRRGDPAEAARWFLKAEKADPSGGDAAFNLATLALERGETQEAVRRLEAAARVLPEEPDIWNNLGCAYYRSGRYEEAYRAFRTSREMGADYFEAKLNLGTAALRAGDPSAAREAGERAVRLSPGASEGYNLTGLAFLAQGQAPKAVLVFARAVSLNPGNAGTWNNLGRAQLALDHESAAEQSFQRALALGPGLKAAQWNLADLRLKQGRSSEALPLYVKAGDAPGADRSASFHYNWGAACVRTGDTMDARRLWEKTLEIDPGHLGALFALAELEKESRRSGPARDLTRRGQARSPQDPRWERLFGDLDRMEGSASKALEHYKRARKLGDTAPDLERRIQVLEKGQSVSSAPVESLHAGATSEEVRRRVQGLWELGENEAALDLARTAEAKWPKDVTALRTLSDSHRILGHREEAGRAMESAVKRAPRDRRLLEEAGNLAFDQSRFADAAKHFGAILVLDPQSQEASLGLGSALFKQYKVEQALEVWRKGRELHPRAVEFCYDLARGYQEIGRKEKARQELEKALELKPDYPEAITNSAGLDLGDGDLAGAAIKLKRSLKLDPTLAETHFNLGNLYVKQGAFEEALKEYRKGLEIHPDDAEGWYAQGLVHLRLEKWQQARTAFEKTLEKNPLHADAVYNLGRVAVETKDHATALKYFEESLEMKPYQADAVYGMGLMHFELGQWEEALARFRRAEGDWKVGFEAAFAEGRTFEKLGDRGSAEMAYRRSLKAQPGFGPAHLALGDLLAAKGGMREAAAEWRQAAAQAEYPEAAKQARRRLSGK